MDATPRANIGDVFQINERSGRRGWIGAFVLVTELKSWGIQGFVAHVETHDLQGQAFIRLKWDEIDYIGPASLVPADQDDGLDGAWGGMKKRA